MSYKNRREQKKNWKVDIQNKQRTAKRGKNRREEKKEKHGKQS